MKNHNLFLLPSFLFLGLLPCSAQYSVDLGFKSGLSIPSLSSGSDSNPINSGYTSRLGADVALFAEFHFTKKFSIQPQLEYSSQGGKKNGGQAFAVPADLRPLFAEAQDNTEKIKDELHRCNAGVTGHIGFSFAMANSSSIFIEGGGNYGLFSIQKDEANGKNMTGAGVVVIGYQFRMQGGQWEVNV